MKNKTSVFSQLALFLAVLFVSVQSFSADRSITVQSRTFSALSNVLDRADFLLIVNRVDDLDDTSASASIDGFTKKLPGLNLGIDSKGNLVRENRGSQSYNGPLSVKLVIDKSVNESTIKTIQKMLPELMGGVQDEDELVVEVAVLRQNRRDPAAGPQIQIQNQMPEDRKADLQEYFKYFSLLLIASGIFFWIVAMLINRIQNKNDQLNSPSREARSSKPEIEQQKSESSTVDVQLFESFTAPALTLFFLRAFKKKKDLKFFKYWIRKVTFKKKKEFYSSLPTWVLEYFLAQEKAFEVEEDNEISMAEFENKLLVLERDCKSENFYKRAFLSWFPAEALRFVPLNSQKSLTDNSKKVLAQLRPDLGNLVVSKDGRDHFAGESFELSDLSSCFEEISAWSSKSNDLESISDSIDAYLLRYRSTIEYLTEFSPIDVQLKQAEQVLSKAQFQELYKASPHAGFPTTLPESELKDWLRLVEPSDFAWWTTLVANQIEYQKYLRPLRQSMFDSAVNEKLYLSWNESSKKLANQRLIETFRNIINARDGRKSEVA